MSNFLSPDHRFAQFVNKLVYCCWLNILWLICSLPIVTIGASTTALFYVSLKVVRNEEGAVAMQFFRAFRSNFKKATQIWLVMLAVGAFLAADAYVLYHLRFTSVLWTICSAFVIGAFALYAIVLMHVFALLSRFENTIRALFVNAFLLGVRYLFCSILMAVTYVAVAYITINIFTPFIVFGQGLCVLIACWLLSPIYQKLERDIESKGV